MTMSPFSRRTALTGLGASGLGVAFSSTARRAAAQDDATDLAAHPVVGLWQFDSGWPFTEGDPDWAFELFHADGTFQIWGGLNIGAALGIWRPTGERTADLLFIWRDTDPFQGGTEGPGTATFRFTVEVDATNTTLTYTNGILDAQDPNGTHLFPSGPIEMGNVSRACTRVTFDVNPATGSTANAAATPTAATPTS